MKIQQVANKIVRLTVNYQALQKFHKLLSISFVASRSSLELAFYSIAIENIRWTDCYV